MRLEDEEDHDQDAEELLEPRARETEAREPGPRVGRRAAREDAQLERQAGEDLALPRAPTDDRERRAALTALKHRYGGSLDEVLAVSQDGTLTVGTPLVGGASVTAELVEQARGPKIIIFKKKRRQNYRRKNGHRQALTVLRITDITG